jgi:hypothetical protein
MCQIQNSSYTVSMLSALAGIIRDFNVPVDQYLAQIGEPMITDPFQSNTPTGALKIPGTMSGNERRILFSSSPIVEFTDWVAVENASGLWDGLYREVIKPLKKRDFHFIFHLGNVANKRINDIDEALDIIGDYSTYGRVMLILDNDEAGNLWSKLNGHIPDAFIPGPGFPRAGEKYHFIFNTMNIDSLVVLHGYNAVKLSREGQVVLPGRPPDGNSEVMDARARFSAGYQLGLLLQLGTWYCMALGLAVLGAEPGPSPGLNASQLLDYLQDWINIL